MDIDMFEVLMREHEDAKEAYANRKEPVMTGRLKAEKKK